VDQTLAERDDKLTNSLQKSSLRLTRAYFQKNYGLADDDIAEAVASNFAERVEENPAGQIEIDKAIEKLSPEKLQAEMEGLLKPIIDLIKNGSSYEDIFTKLVATYPEMDSKGIEDLLQRAIFISELWGILNGQSD